MTPSKEPLTIAERCVRWNSCASGLRCITMRVVFHNCIVGGVGGACWKNGTIRWNDSRCIKGEKRGKKIWGEYPNQISEAVASRKLMNHEEHFPHVNTGYRAPIDNIPDDIHEDWIRFISFQRVWTRSYRLTLLYKTVLEADYRYCALRRMRDILHASYGHYAARLDEMYYAKIGGYKARLHLIKKPGECRMHPDRTATKESTYETHTVGDSSPAWQRDSGGTPDCGTVAVLARRGRPCWSSYAPGLWFTHARSWSTNGGTHALRRHGDYVGQNRAGAILLRTVRRIPRKKMSKDFKAVYTARDDGDYDLLAVFYVENQHCEDLVSQSSGQPDLAEEMVFNLRLADMDCFVLEVGSLAEVVDVSGTARHQPRKTMSDLALTSIYVSPWASCARRRTAC